MDYKDLIARLNNAAGATENVAMFYEAATAITDLLANIEFEKALSDAYKFIVDRYSGQIVPLFNDRLREARDARDEADRDSMMTKQEVGELVARAEAAEARLEMAHAELEAVRKAQMENQARAEKAEREVKQYKQFLQNWHEHEEG